MKRLVVSAAAILVTATSALAAQSSGVSSGVTAKPGNREAVASPRASTAAKQHAPAALKGQAQFMWAANSTTPQWFGPLKIQAQIEQQARSFLQSKGGNLGVMAADLDQASLISAGDNGTGPSVARFQQRINGLPVYAQTVNVLLSRNGMPVAASGSFTPVRNASTLPTFAISDSQALIAALQSLNINANALQFSQTEVRGEYRYYAANQALVGFTFRKAPRVKSVYFKDRTAGVIPAYLLEIEGISKNNGQIGAIMVISAVDGRVLRHKNMIAAAAFTYRVFADASGPYQFQPNDSPLGNNFAPFTGAPGEDRPRTPVPSVLVTLDSLLGATDPWLPAGATVISGNNVNAYNDSGTPDGYFAPTAAPVPQDLQPTITAANTFDYPAATDADPNSANGRASAAVNLFYVNNWLHDFWYIAGFDEASGNAQANNYGRGGAAGDAILGEGQDNSGRNNANMATPGDGSAPTMQMYLFDGSLIGEVCVRPGNAALANCPSDAPSKSGFEFAGASFGPQTFNVTANAVLINDGQGTSNTDGCSGTADPATGKDITPTGLADNPPRLTNMVAVIDRGGCAFTAKETYAISKGAAAMLVCQNADGPPSTMGNGDVPDPTGQVPPTDPAYTIPAVMISKASCNLIKAELTAGRPVPMHLMRDPSIDRDGTFDNLIIAHEFYHYVSNRLVNDGSGLNNQQGGGMGEGWGDFSSIMLAVREEDTLVANNDRYQSAYSSGVYVDTSYYFGIRRQPYSTDFNKNSLMFRHIQDGVPLDDDPALNTPTAFGVDGATNSEVHNTGEVWAQMLWQCYAGILNTQNNGSFSEKRDRMASYVVSGLKMTPSDPTLTQARDGVWAAAFATNYADYEACTRGFALRGAGVYAVAPPSDSADNVGVTENGIALVANFSLTKVTFIPGSACDTDGILDSGESGQMELTFRNDGTYVPKAAISAVISAAPGAGGSQVTFANGGRFSLPALSLGQTATVQVPVSAGTFTQSTQSYSLNVTFDPVAVGDPQVQDPAAISKVTFFNHDGGLTRNGDDMQTPATSLIDWDYLTFSNGAIAEWSLDDGTASGFTGGTGISWFVPDPSAASDVSLVTPEFSVPAAASFSMAFDHQFSFETDVPPSPVPVPVPVPVTAYDGGVIEISVNGGAWQDVLAAGGSFTTGNGYNFPIQALGNRMGFGGSNNAYEAMVLDFGTALAGKKARIRFRAASDAVTGAVGWSIDNVQFTGITSSVFSTLVTEDGICVNQAPVIDAIADFSAPEHPSSTDGSFPTVNLSAVASDKETASNLLTIQWTQTGGQTVMLIGANTLTPSFVTPIVTANTPLTFSVTVTDAAGLSSTDTVVVTIADVNLLPSANAGMDQNNVTTGNPVTLNGSGVDPDAGDTLSYAWTQQSGPVVTLTGANTQMPQFTPTQAGTYVFALVVTDNRGGSSTADSSSVTASAAPVDPPPVTPAPANITPAAPPSAGSATTKDSKGRFGGGAIGWQMLLILALCLGLRRRGLVPQLA